MTNSEAGRKAFEEWWSKQKDLQQPPPDETGIAFIVWQARRTSLLAEIQSPECVEEVGKAIADCYATNSIPCVIEMAAKAAISTIINKLNGEK